MGEITKLVTCLLLVFHEENQNAYKFGRALRKTIIENKLDTLKVCIPSLLYVIQNNLLYVSAANLDAATNQVSNGVKRYFICISICGRVSVCARVCAVSY